MSREHRLERFAHLPALEPRLDTLPDAQRRLWPLLGDIPDDFVLCGGTALALHLGHRSSVDFDFFSARPFVPTDLLATLRWLGPVTVIDARPDTLSFSTADAVRLSFFGAMEIQVVAEQGLAHENGLVIASVFDLAGSKAKALLDRSEWKDYVDLVTLLRDGHRLVDIIGYATTIFEPLFAFPAAVFLRSIVFFEDGTAPDVPEEMQRELEAAVERAWGETIPVVEPYASRITP
ncbi:MAG: nucleotidyl transferase AbiEii/AbiGii toxin family protein [Chloroflexota bacterium]|nr:nucleotidyl transferase AbiEii/AbiGii toxin family protein [Chloroflexota bacterium]